ncbi:MAG: gliding motility-associated C-terminal domain-containing protein [Bacteroidia bacterium]
MSVHSINAQKRAAMWCFGLGAGLNFNCNPPDTFRAARSFYSLEGCASISDTDGNLLFYTNGDSAYSRNHKRMPNGFDLGQNVKCGSSSTQGSLIIPVPESDSLFYIFTTDCAESRLANGFRYSIVDLSLNGGMGDVTVKYQLLTDSVCEKLTAVHHANGRDIWVLTHKYDSDAFHAFLVTPSGLNTTPIVSNTGAKQIVNYSTYYPECMARGTMKFSPNGKKLVVLSFSDCHPFPPAPEIFDFDNSNGKVKLDFTVNDPDSIMYYGAAFSSNSKLLYFSSAWRSHKLHQFDLSNATNSASFMASKKKIFEAAPSSNPPLVSGLCLGPNGKIYVSTNRPWLDVIHNPENLDTACNFEQKSIILKTCPYPTSSALGVPNFIESYFQNTFIGNPCKDTSWVDFSFKDICLGDTTTFTDLSGMLPEKVSDWKWDFGDPNTGNKNFSYLQNPKHIFSDTGKFSVQLITSPNSRNASCKFDTIQKTIQIKICKRVGSLQSINICEGDTFYFNGHSYAKPGQFFDTLSTYDNQDSIVTSLIQMTLSSRVFLKHVLCENDSFKVGNRYYSKTGVYKDTFQNYLGCDSIVVSDILKLPKLNVLQTFNFCEHGQVKVGDTTYTEEGVFLDTLKSYYGCDSFIQTEIQINQKIIAKQDVQICPGDTVFLGFKYFTDSGTFNDTNVNYLGCDSITELKVSLLNSVKVYSEIKFCEGDSVQLKQKVYSREGILLDTFQNYLGCDSIIETKLLYDSTIQCACGLTNKIPNVFTPNGDLYNEQFPGTEIKALEIHIFNRWGVELYSNSNGKAWDGKLNGVELPSGTYFYMISYKDCKDTNQQSSGVLRLIR